MTSTACAPSSNRCSKLGVQVAGKPMVKPPNERDRPITLVPHISSLSQAPERAIVGPQPREKDHVRAALAMPDVPLPHLAIG